MSRYEGWNLQDLKVELRKRGAKISGRKHELVDRLDAYDRNSNFGRIPEDKSCTWRMNVPDAASYKDVTTTTCIPLTAKQTTSYLDIHEAKLGKKSRQLYEERFLRYAKSSQDNNHVFIRAQCRAEMKKTVTYDQDLQLDHAGNIVACQCDCTAGMGPGAHCKHVRTLLYGLLDFTMKKTINVELSCTGKLQSFHRPKKIHTGSPVMAENLQLRKDMSNILFDPMEELCSESDQEYSTRVRNLSINYAAAMQERMPILQTYVPANPIAIDKDHDYLSEQSSEIFLKEENITEITEQEIAAVELKTQGQNKNPLWLVERTKRIQSSNFGKIVKSTEKRDFDKLAHSFMVVKDIYHVRSIKHGIDQEENALKNYESVTGNVVQKKGIIVDHERPYLRTSVDGITGDIVVEVKCPFSARMKKVDHTTVPYLQKTPDGLELDKKHDYYYQIQGQLYIAKKSECHLVVYTMCDMKIVKVFPDAELIKHMLGKLDSFFLEHFKPVFLQKYFFKDYSQYNWNSN